MNIDISVDKLDVSDPVRFAEDSHWPLFERLRNESPIHYCKESPYGPYWSVTKYKDIVKAELDTETFSSDVKYGGIHINTWPEGMERSSFISADGYKHDSQRRIVSPAVAPNRLVTLEREIRFEAASILDGLPRGEDFNWVDHVSVDLTGRVLCKLMDLPMEDRHKLTYWSDIVNVDIAHAGDIDTEEKRFAKMLECRDYFAKVFNERVNQEPRGDLISMLAHSEATRNLGPKEFLGMILLLMVGGNDTTRNSISAGVLAFHENPEEKRKLDQSPALLSSAVSEIIRWATPVIHMRRTATRDTEFGGKQIRAGEKVVLWYISGNRDNEVFENPDRFSIDRNNPRSHMSFGYGVHRCMGNRLAELQIRVLWEEMMKRKLKIEVVGKHERKCSNFIRGLSNLPVRIN